MTAKRAKHGSQKDRASPQDGEARSETKSRGRAWSSNLETIAGAVALAFFIRIVIFEAFEIEGPSMEPTLLNGDRVVVAKFRYGLFLPFTSEALVRWSSPRVGQVVIVKSPEGVDIVKRVVGLEGDVIEIRNEVVFRNEVPVVRRYLGPCDPDAQLDRSGSCQWFREIGSGHKWRTSKDANTHAQTHPPVVVPKGHVYVLGDHRDRSNDSRFFGTVSADRIKGQALAIYWSSDRGWWWDPQYVFRAGRMFHVIR